VWLTPKACYQCSYGEDTVAQSKYKDQKHVVEIVFSVEFFFQRVPKNIPLPYGFHKIFPNKIVREKNLVYKDRARAWKFTLYVEVPKPHSRGHPASTDKKTKGHGRAG